MRYAVIAIVGNCNGNGSDEVSGGMYGLFYTRRLFYKTNSSKSVLSGRDVSICLSTGYGKSLCHAVLPWAVDELLRKDNKQSIVLVMPPLSVALNN